MAKTELTLAQAKRIAGRVGARISVKKSTNPDDNLFEQLVVTIAGRQFRDLDGNERQTTFYVQTPLEAAHFAVMETAKHAHALVEVCKKAYVDEAAFWQAGFHGGDHG